MTDVWHEDAEAWRSALRGATSPLARSIDVVEVGPERLVRSGPEWTQLREIGPTGALLVRPDSIVAWRSHVLPEDPGSSLAAALDQLTGSAVPTH